MEYTLTKSRIRQTEIALNIVNENASEEVIINDVLDRILDFKKQLIKRTNSINKVSAMLSSLSWLDTKEEDSDECNKLFKKLFVNSKSTHEVLIESFVNMNYLRLKGIAKSEIKEYKGAVDYFKETYTDLEMVFFILPNVSEFQEANRKLALL